MAKELKELTKRADNYSQWFNDLVRTECCSWLYGNQALWLCHLGEDAAAVG